MSRARTTLGTSAQAPAFTLMPPMLLMIKDITCTATSQRNCQRQYLLFLTNWIRHGSVLRAIAWADTAR